MTSSEVAVERATKMLTATWRLSSRPCDSCSSSASMVFCRVDSAFLCLRCDSKIHGASTAHARVWVCEVCEQAPAAVTCRADAAALCGTCDADIHSANPLARRHERVPIVPFHETPSTVRSVNPLLDDPISAGGHPCGEEEEAEAASWLLLDPNPKVSEAADVGSKEFCFSDLDYPCLNDNVVPVQTKGFQVQQGFVPSSAENCVVELDFRRSKATTTTYSAYATAPSLTQSVISLLHTSLQLLQITVCTSITISTNHACGNQLNMFHSMNTNQVQMKIGMLMYQDNLSSSCKFQKFKHLPLT